MKWEPPWQPFDELEAEIAAQFVDELSREVAAGHPLYGVRFEALARSDNTDDVVVRLMDGTARIAEVHLTWTSKAERPPWPQTRVFASLDEWRKAAEDYDTLRKLDLPMPLQGRTKLLTAADRNLPATVRRGVIFVMAYWSSPARMTFASLKRSLLTADPDGLIELVVVDIDGSDDLLRGPDFGGSGLAGVGETIWICKGRSTAVTRTMVKDFTPFIRSLLDGCD